MPDVYVGGVRIRLDPSKAIGKGGEADIYAIDIKGVRTALKLFKPPDHPDYEGQPSEQLGAKVRIETHQRKLPALLAKASTLPQHAVHPIALATNASGSRVVGYTMPMVESAEVLLKYGQRTYRTGISNTTMVRILLNVHTLVHQLHTKANIVLGDFNDLNVLVRSEDGYILDIDSAQFDTFLCTMFTQRFVDPLLCDPTKTSPQLVKPHTMDSDWYAFAVMVMQSLLFVHPFDGIYKPADHTKHMPHAARPLHRISVFHPDVRYPKPATPYRVLPDDLLQYFNRVFVQSERGVFPTTLLEHLRWTTCTACTTEHARATCPECSQVTPAMVQQTVVIRGTVKSTRTFRTRGVIVHAAMHHGKLRWLYHEHDAYQREDGSEVLKGPLQPQFRFRLLGNATVIGNGTRVVTMRPNMSPQSMTVGTFGNRSMIETNGDRRFWMHDGRLWADGQLGPERIGNAFDQQTVFWVGPTFGFGFYRAGTMTVAFVFSADKPGINDSVKLPKLHGQLVDATCVFTKDRAWFFVALQHNGVIEHHCFVILPNGTIEATGSATLNDGSWLGTLRGKCATGTFVLAATDQGIVRVESANGALCVTKEFPDTEPFVNAGCHLFANNDGLHVVDRNEIRVLTIS